MQSKYFIPGIVVIVIFAAIAFFAVKNGAAPTADNMSAQQNAAQPGQQAVRPINENLGSVSGVNLNEFGTQANQSASLSAQDGSNDAQAFSSDGQTINSSTDSVNNPIQ